MDSEPDSFSNSTILVKGQDVNESKLSIIDYTNYSNLFIGSDWYVVKLGDSIGAIEAVRVLRDSGQFEDVDYDYIMKSDATLDISMDHSSQQEYLNSMKIKEGWDFLGRNDAGKTGGDPSVVIAIIDTGVDYNHIDLRGNIWTNSGEIPGNGIDDDGNGYVDDYYGWDFVDDDNDPMDDNGHGTHVAGISAASKNGFGTVGVAYNCKIMCLKAGNASGYFSNSDIAEAVRYAQANGASVINMSFGGSSISSAVKDALMGAYNQCVLVAAAGNDGLCNNLAHYKYHDVGVSYPAALPYVIGVMSCNIFGTSSSYFSNYDDTPYNSVEYEVYACGEGILSLWPDNKLAIMSGTSMAAPIVSGIAALLRSEYADRNIYSTKYIQSQIVNTGTPLGLYRVADAKDALEKTPTPDVNLYDFYIFDQQSYAPQNNCDGVVDAGETIRVGIELQNRGGVASNVELTISSSDSHFDMHNYITTFADIGTYSVRDGGKIYNQDADVVGVEKYIEIKVSDNCPNGYLANFTIDVSYKNGLDSKDLNQYYKTFTIQLMVSNGFKLPSSINEDTVFDNDKHYIVSDDVLIPEGITVRFTEGCIIDYYDRDKDYYNSPKIIVYGSLIMEGSDDDMIVVRPNDSMPNYCCIMENHGYVSLDYVSAINLITRDNDRPFPEINNVKNSIIDNSNSYYQIVGGQHRNSLFSSIGIQNLDSSKLILDGALPRFESNGLVKDSYIQFDATKDVYIYINDISGSIISSYAGNYPVPDGIITINGSCIDVIISTEDDGSEPRACKSIDFKGSITNTKLLGGYDKYKGSIIKNYYNSDGTTLFTANDSIPFDSSKVIPFVESIVVKDSSGNNRTSVGKETITIVIEFNRMMNQTDSLILYYGSVEPYSDYKVEGDFVSSTIWEGETTIGSFIDNGTQHFSMIGGSSIEGIDLVKTVWPFSFDIDTTAAMSMNLRANPTENGVELNWDQDDYETLMGYNIYRSTEKDGNYVRINTNVIPVGENIFVDDSAEPGVTYWYTFTVVFSDLTESIPAGKVTCTPWDTIAPVIYHTPVNQGYLGKNLVISCTVTDNISVTYVTLFYRIVGSEQWDSLEMSKQNDRFTAAIYGSYLSLDGLEYYIEATDGHNTISRGVCDDPFIVTIKDSSAISTVGDVDGDGLITIKDAQMILQHIGGMKILSDDQFIRADLNGNGTMDMVEVLRILQYINGNVNTLEMTS